MAFDDPDQITRLRIPGSPGADHASARAADLALIAQAPEGFLDTTHFDTVRFPPPPWAADVFDAAQRDGAMAYSPYRGHLPVREAVARNVSGLMGMDLHADENIVLVPGTQAGLFATLSALVGAEDKVALATPDYLFSGRILSFLGADITHVPLLAGGNAGPGPDMAALAAAFAGGARLFVFSHPNNPTGAVFSAETLAEIARLAIAADATVLVDELYARLLHDGTPYHHLAALPGMARRTVTLLGPSKTESLSGYRLGVVVAPPALSPAIEDVLSITALRAPAYAQTLLAHWLAEDGPWVAARIRDLTALRAMTERHLRRLPWLKLNLGQGTAYAWPDVGALGMSAYAVAERLLVDAGVLVSPGYQFGPDCNAHFRVCYARDEGEWDAALDRMVGVLSDLGTARGL
ncbi:MAG: aminotransferase class I/II-fold pyridoxal phosphate-dependent enzyme [Limimaricola sp.]|uniref:aminotransferase class I/II-fold pyridoxal phosphate-dependent enzyme n=1 Tax=Limimaricola sp. TaxID=2211665 RepID=UPI001DD39907|nr:aminotransferase class I/II-fold pyridoxal phosphate-dependent enzyme [Limimaricola sp.]MBI1415651.1 aminotransferase class I/II-fold pyridoxal phosphate-dependent enzyme [Limimaricola sp.]